MGLIDTNYEWLHYSLLLLLLHRFSRVRLCATPQTAAHQALPSPGFSRQEHWSGLPFPSPMHASEKWKWSHSVMFDPQWPHGLQPSKLLCPWDFPGKSTGVGCHCLLHIQAWPNSNLLYTVEVTNRFKGLDLIECLKNYGWRLVTLYRRQWPKPSQRKRNTRRQSGCLRRPYK